MTPSRTPRTRLPRFTDRLPLGVGGLHVSPFCLGMTADPRLVLEAFERGINFFFVTADLHWPLYAGLRTGLVALFQRPGARAKTVVAVVSYLEDPLFRFLQFNEVLQEIPGMGYVDVALAGAVSNAGSLHARLPPLQAARTGGSMGIRAIGGTFHDRGTALLSAREDTMDIHLIRYNSAHPGAQTEVFPHLSPARRSLLFSFKSMVGATAAQPLAQSGHPAVTWRPAPVDYYRFVLSTPAMDGILMAPQTPLELAQLQLAMEAPMLTEPERDYMMALSMQGAQLSGGLLESV